MGYIARLSQGFRTLNISSGRYALMQDFIPPTVEEIIYTAAGTSANRTRGASNIGKRAVNRDWGFSFRAMGTSVAETDRAIEDVDAFLRMAGDDAEPLYFEFKPDNNYNFEPLWGQFGAYKRLEIIAGSASKTGTYTAGTNINQRAQIGAVTLNIKPYALGKRQRLATATGCVQLDNIGTVDGRTRGLVLSPTGNKMTNPIFGHGTPLNGWTPGADIVSDYTNDKHFVLFGQNAAKLVRITTGINNLFVQTIDVGNTNTHTFSCYVKAQDGGSIVAGDMAIRYAGSTLTTSYQAIGNDWYRLTATAAGVASAQSIGVAVVRVGRIFYVDGYKCEQRAFASSLTHGDMLGATWSGTAHASDTVVVDPVLSIPGSECLTLGEGTFRIAVRMCVASADYNVDGVLLAGSGSTWALKWRQSTSDWYFFDNTNSCNSATTSFALGDIIVFHATFSRTNGLVLYRNGVSIAANATYTPLASIPTWLYIGSVSTAQYLSGTIMGFATFDREMTAAEVLNDYNNIYPMITESGGIGSEVEAIPWVWTKDGDNVVDQYDDVNTDDFCVIGGIPGTAPADTIFDLSSTNNRSWLLSNNPYREYLDMSDAFVNEQGTVVAGALGGQVYRVSINTTDTVIINSTTPILDHFEAFFEKPVYIFASIADAGANLQVRPAFQIGGPVVYGDYQSIAADGTLRDFLFGPMRLPSAGSFLFDWLPFSTTLNHWLYAKRTVAGAANVDTDFIRVMFGNAIYVYINQADTERVVIHGAEAFGYNGANIYTYPSVQGEPIELEPDLLNHLIVLTGDLGAATLLTATATINRIYVTPRYRLL